jgi:acyl-CoA thioesterase-1
MACLIEDDAVVLFQGDSVTDTRRATSVELIGNGYPKIASSWFSALYPEKNVNFINRGISGNRAKDLVARWQTDCIDLKPTWVSILIGINDTWRRYDSNDPTSAEAYEASYREILKRTKEELGANLIICEPFLLPVSEERKTWRVDLDPKIHVARELAREFNAIYIPLDGIFAAAAAKREPMFWAPDGVHPSLAGHALIAQEWLKAIRAI